MANFHFTQIGTIHSPYKEKFAIPRQPGLVEDGTGQLELLAPYNQVDAVRGLEQFSHLWVIFVFHHTMEGGWHPLVRPPRLGGNAKMGVFATRSTFRPNPIGMSLVELKGIQCENSRIMLELGSLDLVDGTPVIDIKPYLPFAESHPEARAGFAQTAPDADMAVNFTPEAECQLLFHKTHYPHLKRFIYQILAQDPRPAYRKKAQENRIYAAHILDFNVRWRVFDAMTEVVSIEPR